MRSRIFAAFLLQVPVAVATAGPPGFHEPNAVLINITESDLDRILKDVFRANGVSALEGESQRPERGLYDLRYRADFSEPALRLGEGGRAWLDVDVLEASLTIGSLRRKVLAREMQCENASVAVEAGHPLDVSLALRFAIENEDLRLVPEEVRVGGIEDVRLHRPTHCRNNPLPEALMWWLGKGKLRRKVEKIDEMLLEKAREGAATLNDGDGLLARHWSFAADGDSGPAAAVHLYPQTIDTSHGSLLVGLAGASAGRSAAASAPPAWTAERAAGSFLGLSQSFLNAVLGQALQAMDARPREPGRSLDRLLRSDSLYALVPGLRGVERRGALRVGFAFHVPPLIAFETLAGRAAIRIDLAGAELTLWDGESWLGAVAIDAATVTAAPFQNPLGGISFEAVENRWQLSSEGVEFDEEILAATFQELLFGEIFETRHEPLVDRGLEVVKTRFDPRYFSQVGAHLVIGLTGP